MQCRICHRQLKNPVTINEGIGPVCKRKNLVRSQSEKAESGDVHVPYDGGAIFIERMDAESLDQSGNLAYRKHPASGIRTNVPRIMTKHSPTGFNFGYAGSGPADFSLNVMLMFCQHADDAYRLYQYFKVRFVSIDTGDRLEIPRSAIEDFLKQNSAPIK